MVYKVIRNKYVYSFIIIKVSSLIAKYLLFYLYYFTFSQKKNVRYRRTELGVQWKSVDCPTALSQL